MPNSTGPLDVLVIKLAAELSTLSGSTWLVVPQHEHYFRLEQEPPRYAVRLFEREKVFHCSIHWGTYPHGRGTTYAVSHFRWLFPQARVDAMPSEPEARISALRDLRAIARDLYRRVVLPADALWPVMAKGIAKVETKRSNWEGFVAEMAELLGLPAKEHSYKSEATRHFHWERRGEWKTHFEVAVAETSNPQPETTITIRLPYPDDVRSLVPALRAFMARQPPDEAAGEAA